MSRIYYAPHRFFPLAVHKTKRHLPFRVSVWFLRTTIDTNELGERVDFAYEPTTEWKKVNIFFPAEAPENFDPAKVRLLRIGMNPRQDQLTYWLRNLKIYYQK